MTPFGALKSIDEHVAYGRGYGKRYICQGGKQAKQAKVRKCHAAILNLGRFLCGSKLGAHDDF